MHWFPFDKCQVSLPWLLMQCFMKYCTITKQIRIWGYKMVMLDVFYELLFLGARRLWMRVSIQLTRKKLWPRSGADNLMDVLWTTSTSSRTPKTLKITKPWPRFLRLFVQRMPLFKETLSDFRFRNEDNTSTSYYLYF